MNQIAKNNVENNVVKIINRSQLLGHEIDVYGSVENPLFLAKDVAKWIEHSDVHKMVALIDVEEKVRNIVPTLGGNQWMWFLTEEGLYEVLMLSRKPIAKQFKKGVKKILKTIRTTGQYNSFNIPQTFSEALMLAAKQQEEIEKQQKQLEAQKPKVKLAEVITTNEQCYPLKDLASILYQKGVNIGPNRLRRFLKDNHYLGERGACYNMPLHKYIEQGLFVITEEPYTDRFGHTYISRTALVTGKGLEYFVDKLYSIENN